jgi:hypothetical protein
MPGGIEEDDKISQLKIVGVRTKVLTRNPMNTRQYF